MKILLINKFLYPNGGSETYLFELGKALEKAGHEVQYFGMKHEGRIVGNRVGAYTSLMDFQNGNTLSKLTYSLKTIYSREARKKIRQVLDDFEPDVCHLNNFNYQLTPSIILEIRKWERESGHKVRIIYTAHDYQLICPNHMLYNAEQQAICEKCIGGRYLNCLHDRCIHGSWAMSLGGVMEAQYWNWRKVYREIDQVICPSQFLKNRMDQVEVFQGKTVAIHNFTDLSRDVLGTWTRDRSYGLYFGRFSEEKGIDTLLQALSEVPDLPFVFAGHGHMAEQLQAFASSRENVKFVGFQTGEALYRLIAGAAFTVYPSEWYENCPMSVMESQILGTPVVASDIGGIPELVQDHVSGVLFQCGNAKDLENRMKELTENKEMAEKLQKGCASVHFYASSDYLEKILPIYKG